MHRTFLGLVAAVIGLLLASPILLGTLLFKVVAFLTQRLAARLEPKLVPWNQLIEFHPTGGWKPKPCLDTHALADEAFHVTTDAEGWRGKATCLAESQVVVCGDSHAFGHAIDDKHHFANLCRDVRVKAIGANGYNMVQQVLWMHELAPQLQGRLVVWFLFLGNDLLDNLEPSLHHYRTPFVREAEGNGGWEIVKDHVTAAPWPFVSLRFRQANYDRLTKIFSPTFVSRRAFGACQYLLAQGADLCRRVGAQLVVMTIPDPLPLRPKGLERLYAHGADAKSFDPDLPDRRIRAICEKLDLPFVEGKSYLSAEHYREHDDHWNVRGHRRVAEILVALHQQYAPDERKAKGEGELLGAPSGAPRCDRDRPGRPAGRSP